MARFTEDEQRARDKEARRRVEVLEDRARFIRDLLKTTEGQLYEARRHLDRGPVRIAARDAVKSSAPRAD